MSQLFPKYNLNVPTTLYLLDLRSKKDAVLGVENVDLELLGFGYLLNFTDVFLTNFSCIKIVVDEKVFSKLGIFSAVSSSACNCG